MNVFKLCICIYNIHTDNINGQKGTKKYYFWRNSAIISFKIK